MINLKQILKGNLIIIIISLFFIHTITASAADYSVPMYGWIWNEYIGWIDMGGNTASYGNNYHVTFKFTSDDDTGLYTRNAFVDTASSSNRYAWNEHIGWIDFYPNEYNPYTRVKYETSTDSFTGYARATVACEDKNNCTSASHGSNSGGWDGWISFDGTNTKKFGDPYTNTSGSIPSDGYSTRNALAKNCFLETNTWAWGGAYTMGWINLNPSEGNGMSFDYDDGGCRIPEIADFDFQQADPIGGNDPVVRTVRSNPENFTNYTADSGITLEWSPTYSEDIAYYELEASVVGSPVISDDYISKYSGYTLSHCLIDHTYTTSATPSNPRSKSLTNCDVRDNSVTTEFIDDSSGKNNRIQIKGDQTSIEVYPVDLSGGIIKYTLKAYNKFGDAYTYTPTWQITSNYSLTMRSWTNIQRNDNRTDVNVFSEIQDSPLDPGTYTFSLCEHIDPSTYTQIPINCNSIRKADNTGDIGDINYVTITPSPSRCPGEAGCNTGGYSPISDNLKSGLQSEYPIVFEGIGIPSTVPILGVYKVDVLMQYTDPDNPDINYPDKARRNTISIRNIGNRKYKEINP